jgi:hypothetical protein
MFVFDILMAVGATVIFGATFWIGFKAGRISKPQLSKKG